MYLTAAAGYFAVRLVAGRSGRTVWSRITPVVGLGLVAVEFVANGSGTALMGLVLVTALGSVVLFVGLARRGRVRVRPVLVAGMFALLAGALTQVPALLALTIGVVETKTGSSSFVARGASNERSIGIVVDTLGLGVGLGGNRPSSLPLFVVSCLGVVGAALLITIVVVALRRGVRTRQFTSVWALLGGLTAGAVAVPDLSTPLIWVTLAACIVPVLRAPHPEPPGLHSTPAFADGVAYG